MGYRDLREFIQRLEAMGELHTVPAEVDPLLEIAAITDRQSKLGGGKGLVFPRVKGSDYAVATNLFGSARRMSQALGVRDLGALTPLMERLLERPETAPAPVEVASPPVREVVRRDPDLGLFPFLKSWPGDAGRFITLPLVFTADRESGALNCGMYRVRIFDDNSAGIRWKKGSGGHAHHLGYEAAGVAMPVAVAVGGPPALALAASMPLPESLDELRVAGYLGGEPLRTTRCLTSSLTVPADAEMVIEGVVEPGARRSEGPFGNHAGTYDEGDKVPVLTVTCITHRRDMIYPATVVGPPPMEDCYLAKAAERLLLPLSRRTCPEIEDIFMPLEGIFHGCAVIAIRKSSPGQGRRVLEALRGGGWLQRGKLLVVVDAGGDPLNASGAFWKAINAASFPRDLVVIPEGVLGIDATRKFPEEGGNPFHELQQDKEVSALVERRWREYGFSEQGGKGL